ncbi:MAG: MFS transporter [Desulfobacterota bacterium]|nr:MFS transporter [Thermodesulfobacteriota bacterium]
MISNSTPRPSRIFYGWYVLAASFLILFLSSGARFTIGIAFKPLLAEFGWSRSDVSLAALLNMTFFSLSVIVTGKWYDRFGPKWVIVVSTLLVSSGYMLIALTQTLWHFLLLYGVIAAMGLGGTTVPIFAALMSKWFEKRRGLTISLALSGNCLGQFALVPVFTTLITECGWRASHFWIGCMMLVLNLSLTFLVIRGDPEDLGVIPYGRQEANASPSAPGEAADRAAEKDLGLGEAMRKPSFWLFTLFMFVCGSGDFLVTTHMIPMVTDFGIPAVTASNMLAWFGLLGLAGILAAGPASDLIGDKIPIALTFLLRVFAFILVIAYQNMVSFYVFALVFGFTFLVTAPLTPTLVGRLYGFSHVGVLSGFITTIHHLGGGIAAWGGGVLFDLTGSYRIVLIISAAMAAMAVVSVMLIRPRRETAHPR